MRIAIPDFWGGWVRSVEAGSTTFGGGQITLEGTEYGELRTFGCWLGGLPRSVLSLL